MNPDEALALVQTHHFTSAMKQVLPNDMRIRLNGTMTTKSMTDQNADAWIQVCVTRTFHASKTVHFLSAMPMIEDTYTYIHNQSYNFSVGSSPVPSLGRSHSRTCAVET